MPTRIAAFNVENLFARAKALNADRPDAHTDILEAHAALNRLIDRVTYTDPVKAEMLRHLGTLGLLWSDTAEFARLRRIRGKLIHRPRNSGTPEIVASGRADWVGWCELVVEPVNALAMQHTALVIKEVAADILAIVEAESRPVLTAFQEQMLGAVGVTREEAYRHVMLIDGNDRRGIDVGLATRSGYPISAIRSHVDDRGPNGEPIFSRDCPEYTVSTPSGETLVVSPNHFKSKFSGNSRASRDKRRLQARTVAGIYRRLCSEGHENVVVLGDLNDTADSEELAPLFCDTDLVDAALHPGFTEVEFRGRSGRGLGTFGLGNDSDRIDYILLSPALSRRMVRGGICRKGAWPGVRPKRWTVFPTLTETVHAASDHHAIWVDLDL